MALVRVAQYGSVPGPVTDYQAQNAHLQAFTNQLMTQQFILNSGTDQPVIKQGCYVSHGGSLYVADADTSITGSPSDGSVYIRVSGTTSLTVEFVTSISGYTWNPVYTALTNGSYTLLPYLIVKAGTSWTRYNFNPNNQQFGNLGAVACTSVDTGQGANALYAMNQNVRTTDSPTFAAITAGTINTGHGANEVFKISNERFTFEGQTVNMAAMAIGEIRFLSASLTKSDSSGAYLKTPADGSYVVVGSGDAIMNSNIMNYTPGNTIIAQHNSTNSIPRYINAIVRRIS